MKCPLCNSELLIIKYDERYAVLCFRCKIKESILAKSDQEAYERFINIINNKIKRIPDELKGLFNEIIFIKDIKQDSIPFGKRVEDLNIDERLKAALKILGIDRLYKFQEEALKKILEGRNVVIVAPPASGKTEAFLIPILNKILNMNKRGVKALLVYPTKALARDQLRKFKNYERILGIRFEVFDGDTSIEDRERIFNNPPDVLITNPDMLHYHLNTRYRFLFTRIDFLVLDEIHEYKGVLGTNVYFIIRRLKRFKKFQIIGSSATIKNPKEFASQLFGEDVELVKEEFGKRKMKILMLYPRKNSYSLVLRLLKMFHNRKVLVFANSHRVAELLTLIAKKSGLNVDIHRAGLSKEHRINVEASFRNGSLKHVISTPTLELGIDIGDVDIVISYIINYTRLLQRFGRAGRKGQLSYGIIILKEDDTISNYYRNYPEDFFSDIEPIYLEIKNEDVAYFQILAASLDKYIREEEFDDFKYILEKLVKEKLLKKVGKYYVPDEKRVKSIVRKYSIRNVGDNVLIKYNNRIIGERNLPIALRELYPNAIYIHGGQIFRVKRFNLKEAELEKYYRDNIKTEPLRYSIPEIIERIESKKVFGMEVSYCKLMINEIVYGYVEKEVFSNKTISKEIYDDEISYSYVTRGFVFKAPKLEEYDEEKVSGSYHALEHVLIESSDMLTGSSNSEIGGIAMSNGFIFIHDACKGGNGVSKLLYERLEDALIRSLKILEGCDCKRDDGCPRCTYSYNCGNNNRPLYKVGAIELIKRIISGYVTRVEELSLGKYYV